MFNSESACSRSSAAPWTICLMKGNTSLSAGYKKPSVKYTSNLIELFHYRKCQWPRSVNIFFKRLQPSCAFILGFSFECPFLLSRQPLGLNANKSGLQCGWGVAHGDLVRITWTIITFSGAVLGMAVSAALQRKWLFGRATNICGAKNMKTTTNGVLLRMSWWVGGRVEWSGNQCNQAMVTMVTKHHQKGGQCHCGHIGTHKYTFEPKHYYIFSYTWGKRNDEWGKKFCCGGEDE